MVLELEFRMEDNPLGKADSHYGHVVREHHRGRSLGTKRLNIGFEAGGNETEQTQQKPRRFVGEGFQNTVGTT